MKIEPTYTSVGVLFKRQSTFFIPKYQRAYAWESESVSDFIKDLLNCFEKRKQNSPINLFFGGILIVKHPVVGAFEQHKYEIIDGQQRIATFALLVACIIHTYQNLESEAQKSPGETSLVSIINKRIQDLSNRFIKFEQEIQRQVTPVEVLTLSKADDPFYQELIGDRNPSVSRDSHRKISDAHKTLLKEIQGIINVNDTIEDKIDNLEIIQNILDNDFTILHMVTENREDAFRLFQVINDRGTNLTDGDLLRAKTLELLEGYSRNQDSVEKLWDNILSDSPTDTTDYLNWIYDSYQGNRPKQNAVFDMFLDKFFPQHKQQNFTEDDAEQIYQVVKKTHEDILKCRKLVKGEWLYELRQPLTSWDKTRLNILIVELGHTLSIPLLLAASELNQKSFSEIVNILEKVFFRYKIVCNQHITPLKNIYAQEALNIRKNPNNYNVNNLRNELQKLMELKASDQKLRDNLVTLEYQESGGSNKPLKYFLMTIEYYYQWYKDGASGESVCLDKSRLYDFAGTSIEHIYPRNAGQSDQDNELDQLKNSLGNLTILDTVQNSIGGNDNFSTKKPLYQKSSVLLTQEIGSKTAWTKSEIEAHQKLLIDAAVAIFRL
ncbi:DUF262 domain-containing protein [Microcystis aeruginosa]|uniref:DUF262 domain-containing protein n=1 Tax=Microcystis aeruginosa FD4 TaxID=2686288 RepID=A0A857D9A6_MICAE|nr:DUF262 domain-containing protein [Microcystis aeruginosa]QGZ92514.1 DUF262 domain-containing protein [Microcystis aeruginosa FD4]